MSLASQGTGEVVRAIAVSTGAQLLAKLLHLVLNVVASLVLIRYLGPASFGDYVFIFSFTTLVGLMSDLGMSKVAVRLIARDETAGPEVLGTTIAARLVLAVVAALLAQVLLAVGGVRAEVRLVTAVASLLFFTEALLSVVVVFQVRLAMQYEALVHVVIQTVDTVLILWLAASSAGLIALVAAPVASSLLGIAVAVTIARQRFGLRVALDPRRLRTLVIESLPVGINLFVAVVYLKLDSVLLGLMRSSWEVGVYGAAYRPIEYLLLASAVLVNTLFPILSRWYALDRARFNVTYVRGTEAVLAFALPVPILLAFTADPLVRALYAPEYAPAALPLQILAVALLLMVFSAWQSFVLLAGGRQRVTLAYNTAGLVANVALNVGLIAWLGYVGAALAALGTSVVITVCAATAGARLMDARADLVRLARLGLAAVLLGICLWIATRAGVHWVAVILVGGALYPAWLLLCRVVSPAELRLLLPRTSGAQRPAAVEAR